MSPKRKPLQDARGRVNEKLLAIEEQTEFIQQSVHQLSSGARKTANSLLGETNKTKFFSKYRAASQELEKCLDDLLLISATIASLDDEDEDEGENEDDENEDGGRVKEAACAEPGHVLEVVPMRNEPCTDEGINPESSSSQQYPPTIDCELKKEAVPTKPDEPKAAGLQASEVETKQQSQATTSTCCNELPTTITPPSKTAVSSQNEPTPLERTEPFKNEELEAIKANASTAKPRRAMITEDSQGDGPCINVDSDQAKAAETFPAVKHPVSQSQMPVSQSQEFWESQTIDEVDKSKCQEIKEFKLIEAPVIEKLTIPTQTEEENVVVEEKATSPTELFAGDVIEEALKNECCEINDKPTKKKGLQIPPFKFPDVYCLEMTVTEIINPCEFWCQQTNGDLDLLMEEMCIFFSKRVKAGDKGGLKELPCVEDVCCARSTEDDIWYRALVTAVSRDDVTVQVLYVDDGNRESLPLSRLRPLEEKFTKLPCQALCCQLSGLKLIGETKMEKVNDWFKRRVSGETLEAVLAENLADSIPPGVPVPIDLYIRPPGRTATTRVDSVRLEYNIHEMMIREGFSARATSPTETGDSESASPASSHSDRRSLAKADSVCSTSTTTTSGFHEPPSPPPDQVLSVDPQTTPQLSPIGQMDSQGSQAAPSPRRVPPPVILVDTDGSVYMLVSYVVSPSEFYVHFVSRDAGKLDTLMEDMNKSYEDSGSCDNRSQTVHSSPCVGDFCCAKFSGDGNWYRAVVLQVRSSLSKAEGVQGSGGKSCINVEVFYIDFGNVESLSIENLRDILPRFMELPAQVVRCSLADVEPLASCTAGADDVFVDTPAGNRVSPNATDRASRRSPRSSPFRKNPRRSRGSSSGYENALVIAAGDEDADDDLLDSFFLTKEPRKKIRSRSSISEDIEKSHRTPSLLSDTAVELFEKVWSNAARPSVLSSWSAEATEYFKHLTKDAEKLVGFLVPWDSQMVNNIMNYCQGAECSLPNLGPVLRLNLYDTSGDEDVFINGAMVTANYATSSTIIKEEEPPEPDVNVQEKNPVAVEVSSSDSEVPIVKTNRQELRDMALTLNVSKESTPSTPDSSNPSSPTSPTLKLLDSWNPMSQDYQAYRNAYNVQTDNLDVAIIGYEGDRGKICQFYRSKYGCFRGNKCPNKHVQQDISGQVCIYGARSSMSIMLPNIGTWVAVRVTAIYDPTHFWVQLPFGCESLDSQIIKSRSGRETSGEETLKDLADLMEKMSTFYAKTFRRERSLAPVAEGELVAAMYKKDKQWYRGKVCLERDNKYQVWFVDYGFSDWLNKSDICPIVPDFLHLPFQAIECFLPNIKPTNDARKEGSLSIWSKDSKRRFESLTEDKLLVCQILSTGCNDTMLLNLFDTVGGRELNISQVMIDSGFAKEADFKITQPLSTGSTLDPVPLIELPG